VLGNCSELRASSTVSPPPHVRHTEAPNCVPVHIIPTDDLPLAPKAHVCTVAFDSASLTRCLINLPSTTIFHSPYPATSFRNSTCDFELWDKEARSANSAVLSPPAGPSLCPTQATAACTTTKLSQWRGHRNSHLPDLLIGILARPVHPKHCM
jgi:hypothetical protein